MQDDLALKRVAERAIPVLSKALSRGNRVFMCGNGGSMAEAQHFAAELVGRYKMERRGLAAVALGSNPAALTAIANDYNFSEVFARELTALGKKGDVLCAFSTSGNSQNVLRAVAAAGKMGITTIGFCGEGGRLRNKVDVALCAPSSDTPRIQEFHLVLIHLISKSVEKELF